MTNNELRVNNNASHCLTKVIQAYALKRYTSVKVELTKQISRSTFLFKNSDQLTSKLHHFLFGFTECQLPVRDPTRLGVEQAQHSLFAADLTFLDQISDPFVTSSDFLTQNHKPI
jgi:hypothetical protein